MYCPNCGNKFRKPAETNECRCGATSLLADLIDEQTAKTLKYDLGKRKASDRFTLITKAGQDIAPIPAVKDAARKESCRLDLELFGRTYFPKRFYLPSSNDNREATLKSQEAILNGGRYALALPRGGGKTTLLTVATIWSMIYGHHRYVVFAAASDDKALKLLDSIKKELAGNALLLEDFPEVCHPCRALEGRSNRSKGQHCGGVKTHIVWGAYELVLPYIEGSLASESVLQIGGITGSRLRGNLFSTPHRGDSVRPSMAFIDDPQDDESARSLLQTRSRIDAIEHAIVPMAGPGRKMTVFCFCTVIAKGDLASILLDHNASPEWRGDKYKILYHFPTDMKLWQDYNEIRLGSLRNGGDGSTGTQFYADHRKAMDAGAQVAWEHNYKPSQLSAIQFAMDWFFSKPRVFWSEFQNSPLGDEDLEEQLDPTELLKRESGLSRATVPLACTIVTAFVDVQKECLFWMVCAWTPQFGGTVLDYGTYPDQQRVYFTKGDMHVTLERMAPGAGQEGALYAGLGQCVPALLERKFVREDDAPMQIDRLLIDANWGQMTPTVDAWIRQCRYGNIVMPSHGHGITAVRKPWDEWVAKPGERLGCHWLIPVMGTRRVRYVLMDTNYWKSFCYNRLRTAVGDRGALTLFGQGRSDHQMLVDHFTSEYWVKTSGRGRELHEWTQHVGRDNDWWDSLYGCAVGASLQGAVLPEMFTPKPPRIVRDIEEEYRREHGGDAA